MVMNIEKLINVMKMKSIHVPIYLIKMAKDLKINDRELLLISILMDSDTLIDYNYIATLLNIEAGEVLIELNNIQTKGLIEIKVIKNQEGIVEEHVSLDNLYNKIALLLINEKEENESNIYEVFEREFGRTLSSMEYEIIAGWLEANYKEEVIVEALREAVYNGASNLRYIDKILYEWNKKGIKSIADVHKNKEQFKASKQKKIEMPDYNWLDDE